MAAPVTDPSQFAPRWPLAAVGAAGAMLAWVLLVPWNLGAQEFPWPAIFSACLVTGIEVLLVVSRVPNGALPVPVGGVVGIVLMYAWRGAATDVASWPFVLIGLVIPLALLTCFAGSAFAIHLVRRRDQLTNESPRDSEPPAGGTLPPPRPPS